MRLIESPKNPSVKSLLRLRNRRDREQLGRFLIEGTREVERALAAGATLLEAYAQPQLAGTAGLGLLRQLQERGVDAAHLSRTAFERLSMRENPDGILAVAKTWHSELTDLELDGNSLLLILDSLEKPGNLGALLRTADATNASAVIVTGDGTDIFNPNVVRASMGALFARPTVTAPAASVRAWLAQRSVRLIASTPHASLDYWDADMTGPVALLLGSESSGLPGQWLDLAKAKVRIPMLGSSADSLNVATAGALLLYEAVRQRRG